MQPTVTLRFSHAILQDAERRGLNLPDDLVAAVQAAPRVSLVLQDQLWAAFCARADDSLIGLRLGLSIQIGHLDAAGMLLMTCETLGEALEYLLDYHPIVGEGGGFELRHSGAQCMLIYQPYYSVCSSVRVEAVFACLLHMIRWTTGDAFQPSALQFSHAPRGEPAQYTRLLDLAVQFEQPENALRFPADDLACPLIQANPELCAHLRELADRLMSDLDSQSLSAQVRALLRQHPRWGKERVAERLHLSGRHLVRKLGDEGASFKLLRATLLQGMAERSLRAGASITQIAEDLGFSDESAFTKAFKRWTHLTPAQFRVRQ